MIRRCENPKAKNFPRYGGRGITVCERWRTSFEAFLSDMGSRPEGKTLDRIDNEGNYEPSNCRWATASEQQRNMRSNQWVEFNGERMIVTDWARRLGISHGTLRHRLARGWSVELAFTTPVKQYNRA